MLIHFSEVKNGWCERFSRGHFEIAALARARLSS